MKKMDENGDNQISKEEFLAALLSTTSSVTPMNIKISGGGSPTAARINRGGDEDDRRVDQALLKIKQGADNYKSLSDYCMDMIRKLDKNKDGMISFIELSEGLREFGIKIFKGEQAALMRRLDEDKDGLIAYEELYNALRQLQ